MLFRELFPSYGLSEKGEVSHRIGVIIELMCFRFWCLFANRSH